MIVREELFLLPQFVDYWWILSEPCLQCSCFNVVLFHVESGLGCVFCFAQWDISKCYILNCIPPKMHRLKS